MYKANENIERNKTLKKIITIMNHVMCFVNIQFSNRILFTTQLRFQRPLIFSLG